MGRQRFALLSSHAIFALVFSFLLLLSWSLEQASEMLQYTRVTFARGERLSRVRIFIVPLDYTQ